MVNNRRLSEEDVQRISCRMKSARMLTGLTQEIFALENDISLTSLKCWEMGRAVPRQEGLTNYLNAIKKHGINVSIEWVMNGSGPGPTYLEGTQSAKRVPESDYLEQQIELFRNYVCSRGLNPIVVKVCDNSMEPYYLEGSMVGGYYISLDKLLSQYSPSNIHKSPWLLVTSDGNFMLSFLMVSSDSGHIFYRENKNETIKKLTSSVVGQICWHHSCVV